VFKVGRVSKHNAYTVDLEIFMLTHYQFISII